MQHLICNSQKKKKKKKNKLLTINYSNNPSIHKYLSLSHSNYMKSQDLLIVWKIPSFLKSSIADRG